MDKTNEITKLALQVARWAKRQDTKMGHPQGYTLDRINPALGPLIHLNQLRHKVRQETGGRA